jgi:transcriptional regulator GlxA family with amidase domain
MNRPQSRYRPRRVSLVALPEAAVSTLTGIYDVLNAFTLLGLASDRPDIAAPFQVEIVGEATGLLELASGVPITVQRSITEISDTDIVIVPSVLLGAEGWERGRFPRLVDWIRKMHGQGAVLCSACSGIFLLAESGLFNGKDTTVHYLYASMFASVYPSIPIHPERVLVVSGEREELVSSGASMSWHDLALYLITRWVGATAAQEVARLFALQWHKDGLMAYIVFQGNRNHGDGDIQSAQQWLDKHFAVAHPVEEMIKRSRLADRTFKRRFTRATGLAPLAYVQRLRVEDAKRRLERTEESVDEVSWKVGYEDPAFFRRLFKRTTGLAPGDYRRRFRIPDFSRPGSAPESVLTWQTHPIHAGQ